VKNDGAYDSAKCIVFSATLAHDPIDHGEFQTTGPTVIGPTLTKYSLAVDLVREAGRRVYLPLNLGNKRDKSAEHGRLHPHAEASVWETKRRHSAR
jgi:hypothetical protein